MAEDRRRVQPLTAEVAFARLEELRALLRLADWLSGLRALESSPPSELGERGRPTDL